MIQAGGARRDQEDDGVEKEADSGCILKEESSGLDGLDVSHFLSLSISHIYITYVSCLHTYTHLYAYICVCMCVCKTRKSNSNQHTVPKVTLIVK